MSTPEELRNRATHVRKLLQRQARRAFVVELAGTPKAGKTTAVNTLRQFFEQCGYQVHVLKERAAECPLPMKGHFFFNTWTTCSMIAEVLAKVDTDTHILILDRGFFDALMWLELQHRRHQVTDEEKETFSRFVLLDRWRKLVNVTFTMKVDAETAMGREQLNRILPRTGSVMNAPILKELNEVLEQVAETYAGEFDIVAFPGGSSPVEDGKRLVEELLSRMEEWSDPQILAVPRTALAGLSLPAVEGEAIPRASIDEVLDTIARSAVAQKRSQFEDDDGFVQIVACGFPIDTSTAKQPDSLFLLKRAESQKARVYGTFTLWKGCHVESASPPPSRDALVEMASAQLVRRVCDDFHLAIPLAPRFEGLAWNGTDNHLALLFGIDIAAPTVVKNMREKEFKQQGRVESLSGRFLSAEALRSDAEIFSNLEPWSKAFIALRAGASA